MQLRFTQKNMCLIKLFSVIYLKQFLRVPDEECYTIIQFLYVLLKITCHHLKYKHTKKCVKETQRCTLHYIECINNTHFWTR